MSWFNRLPTTVLFTKYKLPAGRCKICIKLTFFWQMKKVCVFLTVRYLSALLTLQASRVG